jgi:hypothetical protein
MLAMPGADIPTQSICCAGDLLRGRSVARAIGCAGWKPLSVAEAVAIPASAVVEHSAGADC